MTASLEPFRLQRARSGRARGAQPGQAFVDFGSAERMPHLPALDGLRGLAVAVVVLFHGNWSWARGGFLGVSMFFTLSGFLICSLLLDEHRRAGRVDLRAFWGRRFRRLLPAAWLTLAAVTALALALGQFGSADRLDVWAALANVANWRFWATGSSYSALFAQPSPLLHFWSLAIEEQCYLLVPPIVAITLARARRPKRAVALVLAALLAGSVVSTLLQSNPDRVYYGTDTRAAELLIGALLAVAVSHEPLRRRLVNGLWPRTALQAAASLAFGMALGAWALVSVSDPFVGNGGLVLVGIGSAVLVLDAAVGVGVVARLLSVAPLRALGRISYGVYLFHWPLFVLITERRTGLGHTARFVLAVVLTLALATLSHRWFEGPVRRREFRLGGLGLDRLAPALVIALVALTFVPAGKAAGFDAEAAASSLRDLSRATAKAGTAPASSTPGAANGTSEPGAASGSTSPGSTAPGSTAPVAVEGASAARPAATPPTFAIFGDSVALSIAYPVATWALRTGDATFQGGDAELGCGIGRGGKQRAFGVTARTSECDAWPQRWSTFVADHQPQIAVVESAQWELVDRQLPGDPTWRTIGDPVYDDYLRKEFLTATDTLSADGALVVWVKLPYYSRLDDDGLPAPMRASHDPARVDRLNAIVADVARARPDNVRIIDLASWMADKIDDTTLRRDGSHFNDTGADALAVDFFGPELLRIWREWTARPSGRTGRSDG
ncbi:MAG: acyltransferase family protein [Acidimicrobiales bacterium]